DGGGPGRAARHYRVRLRPPRLARPLLRPRSPRGGGAPRLIVAGAAGPRSLPRRDAARGASSRPVSPVGGARAGGFSPGGTSVVVHSVPADCVSMAKLAGPERARRGGKSHGRHPSGFLPVVGERGGWHRGRPPRRPWGRPEPC